jgi:hypothetical protein
MALIHRSRFFGFIISLCYLARSCHSFVTTTCCPTFLNRCPSLVVGIKNEIFDPSASSPLLARKDPDNDDGQYETLPFLPLAISAVTVVAFWPLLALLRDTNDPTYGFDVDMFMALKGILDSGNTANFDGSIIELPPLSPAEQLVGAIFGPP